MAFALNTRKVDGVIVVDFSGKLTSGEPTLLLREEVRRLLDEQGERKFILNLEDLSYIDSSGLGGLIETHESVRRKGGNVILLSFERAKDVLGMWEFLRRFATYADEDEAVRALNS